MISSHKKRLDLFGNSVPKNYLAIRVYHF